MHRSLLLALALLASPALAQTPGSCDIGQATGTLDVSDVAATVFTTGTIAYGPGGRATGTINVSDVAATVTTGTIAYGPRVEHGYYVPRSTRLSPLYAASVWIGGTVGGEFRVAGATYGQGGTNNDHFEFWPGPLNDDGTLPDPDDCSAYDRVWVVSVTDLAEYEQTRTATDDLRDWPVGLGAPAVDASGAPVVPTSRDQTLNLAWGERPVISGSQTAFWVMNDVGNEHRTTGSAPLGIEVAVTAFSIASDTLALDRATFYRYAITNRNALPIEDARFSVWADPDLGSASDDYIGVDTTRSLAFVYNADEVDDGNYGPSPPAWGVDVLGGLADDGRPDLAAFLYGAGGDANRSEPNQNGDAVEYQRYMQGRWPDGTPLTAFGSGYRTSGEVVTLAYPGDPVTGAFWSEESDGDGRSRTGEDRRFTLTIGPETIPPGETRTVDLGFVFALGTDRLDSVVELRAASDLVQAAYDDGSLFATAPLPERTAVTAAPVLLSPADGAGPFENQVTLEWEGVPEAMEYDLELNGSSTFEDPRRYRINGLTFTGLPQRTPGTVYWRVRGRNRSETGPYSETRSFRYDGAPSQLPEVLGVVEVVGPGGADPCAETAQSRDGCPSPGERPSVWQPGNSVYHFSNSTGDYRLSPYSASSMESLPAFAPNDYEIRFVAPEEGAYAYHGFSTGRVTRVPFQVWDIGVVAPGEENDPADDVQLVPLLYSDPDWRVDVECAFAFADSLWPGERGRYSSPRIYAYYPVDDDYSAWAELAAPLAADCASSTSPASDRAAKQIDFERGRPLQSDRIVDLTSERGDDFSDLEGVVIRYYTNDSFGTPNDPDAPDALAVTLGTPYPNPVGRVAFVPYRIATPGPIRLAVLDVLGREVAVLVDGMRSAGAHEARLDAARLAAGVYVVVVETASGRASRTVTVVR